MKRTIWKFTLAATDRQTVEMPDNAQVLSAQMQGETLCLWALVYPDAPKTKREIEVFGTGHPVPPATRRFISTVQMHGGALIFHVFERE